MQKEQLLLLLMEQALWVRLEQCVKPNILSFVWNIDEHVKGYMYTVHLVACIVYNIGTSIAWVSPTLVRSWTTDFLLS